MHRLLPSAVLLLIALVAPPSTSAQTLPADSLLTVGHYLDWESVDDPRISPDGSRIAYTRARVDEMQDEWASEIWIMRADGGHKRMLVDGYSPRWSPDGSRIAYLAEAEDGSTQIFVRWMDGDGGTLQVTHAVKTPRNIEWSPGGERIAFTMHVPGEETWRVDLPRKPEGAEWTAPPRVIERVHFRADRRGFLDKGFTHLFVVPAHGGTARQLTRGEWDVGGGLDWMPEGEWIVFDGLRDTEGYPRYRVSHLYRVNLDTGELRRITERKGPWSGPVVSPDGRWIAYTGFPWTEQTYRERELYVIHPDGTGRRLLTGELDRSPGNLHWAPDGGGIYFTAGDRGTQNIYLASLGGGVSQVTGGTHMLDLESFTEGGLAVGVRTSFHEPGDVVRFRLPDPGGLTELTHVNDDVLAGIDLGAVEEIWYRSRDGTRIQGWIIKPPDFDPDREYPLVLYIHGGPHAMYDVGFSYSFQNLAANGYVVLYTNPRGSTGYGTAFGNAIDEAYPSVDYHDLMAGVDALLERGYIDPDNTFVTGCSGGGVLSSWTVGHTDRFEAAAVRCPVINWLSFPGTTDIVVWAYQLFPGYPWTNPEPWLEHSPLMYAENVDTPTLLMTGALDLRTPISQSEEFYQALKAEGVPTKLLRFKKEYHGTSSQPSNFMRTQLYLMKWFRKWGSLEQTAAE